MERGPIFIGGLDRSGKTLMRLSLSAHPNLALTRRTYMWTNFYNRYGDLSDPANLERCLAAMLRTPAIRAMQPELDRIRREFRRGEPAYGRLFGLFHEQYAERLGKPRWGDQLGLVERYADPIFAAYPAAKMIHMIRDPRKRYEATLTSARRRRGKIGGATAGWLYSVGLARRNRQRYPERYRIVLYEELRSRPEETLREVCAFLDEDFVPGMLAVEGAGSVWEAAEDEMGEQAHRESGAASEGNSSQAISTREVAFMQAYAGRDMVAYGYRLQPAELSLRDRLVFSLVDWPTNVASAIAWRVRGHTKPVPVA